MPPSRPLPILLAVLLSGCTSPTTSTALDEQPLPHVASAEVELRAERLASEHLVILQPVRRARIAARYGGEVIELPTAEQSEVQRGTLLVRLAAEDLRGGVLAAEGAVEAARAAAMDAARELEVARALAAEGAQSARTLERAVTSDTRAQATLKQAEGQLIQVRDRLAAARLTAPFRGLLTELGAEVGEFIAPGAPVAVVSDLTSLAAEVPLGEAEAAAAARDGLRYVVEVRGEEVRAELEWIAGEARSSDLAFPARLLVPNPDGLLKAGETARVRLGFGQASSGPAVPPTAVRYDGDAAYVLRLDGDVVRRVPVRVLGDSGDRVLLRGELADGARVVATGPAGLGDGDRVVEVGGRSPTAPTNPAR